MVACDPFSGNIRREIVIASALFPTADENLLDQRRKAFPFKVGRTGV